MIDLIGGPDRDRTDDLFHAMEARSQLRHRPTFSLARCRRCSHQQLLYYVDSGAIRQILWRGVFHKISLFCLEPLKNFILRAKTKSLPALRPAFVIQVTTKMRGHPQ
jgi:hypothetical protein